MPITRNKDTAIANPETNSGPRYPYAVVIWQGKNHRIVLDETPSNAQDTTGGGTQYNTKPGGGVFQISGKDGSVIELAADSGRVSIRGTGQSHFTHGKGKTETTEGHADTRVDKGNRKQTGSDNIETNAGDQHRAGAGIQTNVNKKNTNNFTKGDTYSSAEGSTVGSASGSGYSQTRGDQVKMHKGENVDVVEGEDYKMVNSGNSSAVFQKSYKTWTDEHHYSRVGQKFKQHVLGSYDMKTTDVIVFESETKIVLKVGDSTIVMNPDSIEIKSSTTKVHADDTLHLYGGTTVKLGPTKIEAGAPTRLGEPWVGSPPPPDPAEGAEGADVAAVDSSG